MLFEQLRVKQYSKQLFVLAPIVFVNTQVSKKILLDGIISFMVFSLISSGIYCANDLMDYHDDLVNPMTRKRPLPSGRISKKAVLISSIVLIISGFVLNLVFSPNLESSAILSLYLLINLIYNAFKIKSDLILSIVFVSFGFPLRFLYGISFNQLPSSFWGATLSFFLAVMLVTGKRWQRNGNSMKDMELKIIEGRQLQHLAYFTSSVLVSCYLVFVTSPISTKHWGQTIFLFSPLPVLTSVLSYLKLLETSVTDKSAIDFQSKILKNPTIVASVATWLAILVVARFDSIH